MILTDNDMIFGFVPELTIRFNAPMWLRKILWACEYCVTGQIALWGYLILSVKGIVFYDWLDHVVFVALSIFIIYVFNRIDYAVEKT